LPFENRYIQTDDLTTTYVPGTSYFTDAIIKTDGSRWNIAPYSQYANRFNSVFSDAKSAINRLLNLSSFTRTGQDVSVGGTTSTVISAISPNELNSLYIQSFQRSFQRLNNFNQLENNQTETGIRLPKVLQPYFGAETI
jgi:alpha-L-fucosidase